MDNNLINQKFNKAVEFEKDKKYFEALKEYLEIISINNKHRETFVNLGSLFSRMNNLPKAMNCYLTKLYREITLILPFKNLRKELQMLRLQLSR